MCMCVCVRACVCARVHVCVPVCMFRTFRENEQPVQGHGSLRVLSCCVWRTLVYPEFMCRSIKGHLQESLLWGLMLPGPQYNDFFFHLS